MNKEQQIAYDWARFRHYAPNLSKYINPLVEIIDEQKSEILSLKAENERLKAEQSNEPLTLEALRQMDGKPAYFQFGTGSCGYAVISWETESSIMLYAPDLPDDMYPDIDFINMEYNDSDGHFGLHLLGWRAYRRKPEERKDDGK